MERKTTTIFANPDTSRSKSWGGILLILMLLVSSCVPAKEAPQVPSASPVQQPTQPATPNVIVMTPTTKANQDLPTPGLDFCNNEQVQAVLTGLIDAVTQKMRRPARWLILLRDWTFSTQVPTRQSIFRRKMWPVCSTALLSIPGATSRPAGCLWKALFPPKFSRHCWM